MSDSTIELPGLTATEARELTDCIIEHVLAAAEDIATAHQRRAWSALGYATWEAYCDAEFVRLALSREQRSEMVAALNAQGMSQRSIASAVGVDRDTVSRDLRSGGGFPPPDRVTGADGRSYPAARPTPAPTLALVPPAPDPGGWRTEVVEEEVLDEPEVLARPSEPSPGQKMMAALMVKRDPTEAEKKLIHEASVRQMNLHTGSAIHVIGGWVMHEFGVEEWWDDYGSPAPDITVELVRRASAALDKLAQLMEAP